MVTTTIPKGGFSFENYKRFLNLNRNLNIEATGAKVPKTTSTGTTIVGMVYKVSQNNSGWNRVGCRYQSNNGTDRRRQEL
jgi:hypothetical protein